jgi:hypothetical protein
MRKGMSMKHKLRPEYQIISAVEARSLIQIICSENREIGRVIGRNLLNKYTAHLKYITEFEALHPEYKKSKILARKREKLEAAINSLTASTKRKVI